MRTARRRDASLLLVLLVLNWCSISADQPGPTDDSLRTLDEWFGPLPPLRQDEPRTARWWSTERDVSPERANIIGIARQFWSTIAGTDRAFAEGLARYSASRVINELLEDRNLITYRFFGGFVSYTVRSIPLSRRPRDPRPLVRRFPEFVEAGSMATWVFARDEADRWADVLHTLERTIGWPAMQQALSEFSRRHRAGTGTAALFAGIVGEQLGSTLGWLDPEDLPTPREVDYVVESVITGPGDPPSSYDTVVRLRRDGAAVFSVPVVTEFADGSRISDPFDGSGDRLELRYRSRAPAVRVSIDPDTVLLLDANRTNNALALERRSPVAFIRPAWNWLIWLQDLLLTCTALA